jgi:uncharacterized protein involved in exopolysaccharide biosynthesis
MGIGHLVEVVKSRIWLLVLLPLVASGTALLLIQTKPVVYAANATILLDFRIPVEGDLAGEILSSGLQSSYLTTQLDIIRSLPVAERVLASVDVQSSPSWRSRFEDENEGELSFDSWALSVLSENVEVTVGAESRLIDVWYRDADPVMAATIANAFVSAYKELNQRLGRNPAMDNSEEVTAIISGLREKLEQAENKVSAYQANTGILATDERLDVEATRLNQMMEQKVAADADLRVAESRARAVDEVVSRGMPASALLDVSNNQVFRELEVQVAEKEATLAELATSLGDGHPEIRKLKAELSSLRGKIVAEVDKIREAIREELLRSRRIADSANQAEETQRQRMLELKQARDGLQPLLRELESARASYDRALELYSQYSMNNNLNQTNVSLLSAAQTPLVPVPKNTLLSIASAFLGGLMFAVGLTFVLELADKRIRDKDELAGLGSGGYLGGLPKA